MPPKKLKRTKEIDRAISEAARSAASGIEDEVEECLREFFDKHEIPAPDDAVDILLGVLREEDGFRLWWEGLDHLEDREP